MTDDNFMLHIYFTVNPFWKLPFEMLLYFQESSLCVMNIFTDPHFSLFQQAYSKNYLVHVNYHIWAIKGNLLEHNLFNVSGILMVNSSLSTKTLIDTQPSAIAPKHLKILTNSSTTHQISHTSSSETHEDKIWTWGKGTACRVWHSSTGMPILSLSYSVTYILICKTGNMHR